MIRARNLSLNLDQFTLAVDSLEVPRGEYAVILGPSGSGKSLLLRLIAGLQIPDRGQVHLLDQPVDDLPPEKRQVGMVFQQSSLFPHLSVTDNIAYGLRVGRMKPGLRKQKVDQLVHSLGLESIVDRPVKTLSGGEAQKVALARALAIDPRILLLDEPLSQVDHHARAGLLEAISAIHQERELTCLHVTHDRDEARTIGQHLALMFGGRMLQSGTMVRVTAEPACPFVKNFLGLDEQIKTPEVACSQSCLLGQGHCDLREADNG